MAYTHTELLDNLKVRGAIPTSQNTFTAARFIVGINDAMRTKVMPFVMRFRESFYSYDVDTSINATGIYSIPSRAIGAKLQNVALLNGTQKKDLSWLSEEELQDTNATPFGDPGFYLKRNSLYLVPKDGGGYSTLRQTIFLRPAEVVAQTSAAQITAIDTGTNTLTFDTGTIPSSFTTAVLYELVSAQPHFDTLGFDLAVSSVTATTLVFNSTLPTGLVVGDWVGLTGQTPVIQCPVEIQPYLAQEAANYCLKGQNDKMAYETGVEEAKRLREELTALFTPRVEKEGKKLVNYSRILRRGC